MPFSSLPRYRTIASLLAFVLLTACASPNAKFYTLAARESTKAKGRPVSMSIGTVMIAKYLDRPQLVRRSDDVQFSFSEFERWAEPMSSMVQRVLAEDLRRRLPIGSLVTTDQDVSGRETVTLELTLGRFDRDTKDMVFLEGQWRLNYRNGRRSAAAQANIAIRPITNDASQVQAMSAALDQLAAQIAQQLR